jgi:putative two-component system response regulator
VSKTKSLLIADDVDVNRAILREMFQNEYTVLEASDGEEALQLLKKDNSIVMILLDIKMPHADGFTVLEQMNALNMIRRIPVIFITGADSVEYQRRGFKLGVTDIISKPFDRDIVSQRVKNSIALYDVMNHTQDIARQLAIRLQKTNDEMIDGFSGLVESRNKESGLHIFNIKTDTQLLLDEYAKTHSGEFTEDIKRFIVKAAAFHDIGKIKVPESILNKPKEAGRLMPDEFKIMQTHTVEGCNILNTNFKSLINDDLIFYTYCMQICRSHHERWDGHGYPDGLKGNDIPICSQIVAVADVYDALVSKRCYKNSFSHDEAMKMITNNECGVFNPELLQCLVSIAPQLKSYYKKQNAAGV